MRALTFLAGLAMAVLTGCASYHVGSVHGTLVAPGSAVEIMPFNNQTLQPRLGDALTKAARERIQTEGGARSAKISLSVRFFMTASLNAPEHYYNR